jgi:hypothetical protein
VRPQEQIPWDGNTILDNWASSVNRMSCAICSYGCSLHRIIRSRRDLPVSCCTLWRWHGWKPSWCKILCTSVLHQSSWKFCKYLYLGFPILLPEHHLHASVAHVLHSPEGRNQSTSKFSLCSQMFCHEEFCKVDITASVAPQLPYYFHCRNNTQNAFHHILHLWTCFIFSLWQYHDITQCNSSLDSVQAGTQSSYCSSCPLNLIMASIQTVLC